jgi:hypothetical protein
MEVALTCTTAHYAGSINDAVMDLPLDVSCQMSTNPEEGFLEFCNKWLCCLRAAGIRHGF